MTANKLELRPVSPGCDVEKFLLAPVVFLSYCDLSYIGVRCILGMEYANHNICSQSYKMEDGKLVAKSENCNREGYEGGFVSFVTIFDKEGKYIPQATLICINSELDPEIRANVAHELIKIIRKPSTKYLYIVTSLQSTYTPSTIHYKSFNVKNDTSCMLEPFSSLEILENEFRCYDPFLNILLNLIQTIRMPSTLLCASTTKNSSKNDQITERTLQAMANTIIDVLKYHFNTSPENNDYWDSFYSFEKIQKVKIISNAMSEEDKFSTLYA